MAAILLINCLPTNLTPYAESQLSFSVSTAVSIHMLQMIRVDLTPELSMCSLLANCVQELAKYVASLVTARPETLERTQPSKRPGITQRIGHTSEKLARNVEDIEVLVVKLQEIVGDVLGYVVEPHQPLMEVRCPSSTFLYIICRFTTINVRSWKEMVFHP